MLEVEGITAGYGSAVVLSDVSFTIAEGTIFSVVGANGAGKTSLVRVISGLLRPTRGRVAFCGTDVTDAAPHTLVEMGIAQVPEGRRLFGDMSVAENLLIGSTIQRARPERQARLETVHSLFPILAERGSQLARTLSGGQQQMLAIGRALMSGPRLLILDEPSLGLAPMIVKEIFETISRLNREGLTILLIEQNLKHSLAIADSALVLENGHVVLKDTGAALLADERTKTAYLGM